MELSFCLKKTQRIALVALCGAFGFGALAQAPQTLPTGWATVKGRVTDARGRPVEDAKISIFPMDVAVTGPRASARTDREGRYRLFVPAYSGRTRLCAVKESAGYPDTHGLLFSSPTDAMPEISLTPGGIMEGVDIQLGPPDGIIEGSVVDSTTGRPVEGARLSLHRDSPESVYSATLPLDGRFLFALPPAPITIVITAPGYHRWTYGDEEKGASSLVLRSNEHKNISAKLIPMLTEKN